MSAKPGRGNVEKGERRNGGTGKGVKKPKNASKRATSGSDEKWLKQDGYLDVGRACKRFIEGRVNAGLMRPSYSHYPKKSP